MIALTFERNRSNALALAEHKALELVKGGCQFESWIDHHDFHGVQGARRYGQGAGGWVEAGSPDEETNDARLAAGVGAGEECRGFSRTCEAGIAAGAGQHPALGSSA